jgi:Ca2+/Na+ antiporter
MRSGHHRRTNDGVRQTVRKYYRAFMIAVLVLVSLVAVYSGEQALANYVTWSSQGQTPRRALLSETSEWDKAACSPIPADKTSGGSWDVKKCCDLPPPLKTDLAAWWNMCKDTDYLSGTPYLQCLEKWHDFDESKKSKNSGNAITSLKARCSDMGVYQQVGMKVGAAAYHPAMNLAYILTLLYLFVALAIVCDEYFVPAIELIQEEWSITPDVAGATIMAAGGSAPELATSFMGVFVSKSNVGFSTIVGSAVFNVLFVIGACAFASKTTLELSAWPLARDCSYYSMTLLALALVYMFGPKSPAGNGTIELYEAIVMLCIYIGYVTLMKWNEQLQAAFQRKFGSKQVTPEDGGENGEPTTTDAPKGGDDDTAGPASDDTARHWTTFRVGILDIILRDKPIDEVLGLHIVHRVAGDAKATFSSIDTDHSGYIDVGEIENLLKEVLHVEPTKEQIDEAMKALVSNSDEAHGGSSKISFEEFNSWYQATTFKVEGQINKLFSKVSAESGSTDTVSEEDFQKLVLYEGKKGKGFSDEEMQEGLQILKNSAGGCMSQEDFKKWALKTSLFKEESEGASLALPDDVKGLFFYILLFPVNATLYFTVPDVRWGGKWKKLYGLSQRPVSPFRCARAWNKPF